MIVEYFSFFLGMILLIVALIMLSNKIKVAYPILLLIAGLAVSMHPKTPVIKIDPHLILIIFLPPLLYEAALANSWKEIWRWRRTIFSFAFIVVFLTAISVAFVVNHFIPGMSLALGFLLGGIVSPPDAVSAGSILKFVKVPKRIATVLEGESLFNDASSLVIFRFASAAVTTGQFIWQDAAISFGWMIFAGVGIGLLIGFIFIKIHQWFPTNEDIDVILSIAAPFIMYIVAEEVLHASGVMSVVCGGLYLSYNSTKYLNSSSRLRGINVWHSLTFLLNGLVFLLIGLDMPEIVSGLHEDGVSIVQATIYGLWVTAVLIIIRIIASYGAIVTTQIMKRFITVADPRIELKSPFIVGWSGMRGVVSLAAALSIPLTLEDDITPFPHRSLILYITFVTIFVTLVFQGLTLPFIIKKINLPEFDDHLPENETEKFILKELAKNSLEYINSNYKSEIENNRTLRHYVSHWEERLESEENMKVPDHIRDIYLNVLEQKRKLLFKINNENPKINEDIIRKFILRIDLEEERIKHE